MGSDAPEHKPYSKMKDTPWITQARDIANRGGQGILDNYNNVNVFDEATRNSLEARNNAVYDRAFRDASEQYANTIGKYNAQNYNQFGTLNATPSAYRTDQYNKDFQRQLDDLAYNKAMNYDNIINNELNRRYNTMNMYQGMYNIGQTPYQQDVTNWNVDNTNLDLEFNNQLARYNNDKLFNSNLGQFIGTTAGSLLGPIGSAFGGSIGGAIGGIM